MRQQDVIMTSASPLTLVAAILLPPLGLFLARGITPAFWVSVVLTLIGLGISGAVVSWVMYAIASGRNLKQRLTDPAPIDEPKEEPVPA